MDFLQRPPEFIGQSALHNSEIQIIPIIDIIINSSDYSRPRDSKRFTFVEIIVSGNYTDVLGYSSEFENSPGGNFTSKGNDSILFNKITKKSFNTLIINSSYSLADDTTTIVIKTSDSSITKIENNNSWNDWILILSCGLDYSFNLNECPEATNLKSSFITRNSVTLTWISGYNAEINYIRIKPRDIEKWTIYAVPGSNKFININGLLSNTTYDWQICTSCELTKHNFYSPIQTFETQP
jgi:hypothetical protein